MRNTRDADPMPPATSAARCEDAKYFALVFLHAAASRPRMPMAWSTSALRRVASAKLRLRAFASAAAFGGSARKDPRQHGQPDKHYGARQCREANPIVEYEADSEIKRHPRQVEQSGRPEPGHKTTDLIKVAHGLEAVRPPALDLERQ